MTGGENRGARGTSSQFLSLVMPGAALQKRSRARNIVPRTRASRSFLIRWHAIIGPPDHYAEANAVELKAVGRGRSGARQKRQSSAATENYSSALQGNIFSPYSASPVQSRPAKHGPSLDRSAIVTCLGHREQDLHRELGADFRHPAFRLASPRGTRRGSSVQALEAQNAESAIAAPLHLVPSREEPAHAFNDATARASTIAKPAA